MRRKKYKKKTYQHFDDFGTKIDCNLEGILNRKLKTQVEVYFRSLKRNVLCFPLFYTRKKCLRVNLYLNFGNHMLLYLTINNQIIFWQTVVESRNYFYTAL